MIGSGSTLQVTDNSGARLVQCINQSGTTWGVGDVITVAVKKAIKGKVAAGTVSWFCTLAYTALNILEMSVIHRSVSRPR